MRMRSTPILGTPRCLCFRVQRLSQTSSQGRLMPMGSCREAPERQSSELPEVE
jgi:hypothetical protein